MATSNPKRVRVTLKRSLIGTSEKQRRVVTALGLRRTNHCVEHVLTPVVEGMLRKVPHLLQVETVEG